MWKIMSCAWMLILAVTACATTGQGNDFCMQAHPIFLEHSDTLCISDELVTEILLHNSKGETLCGWNHV